MYAIVAHKSSPLTVPSWVTCLTTPIAKYRFPYTSFNFPFLQLVSTAFLPFIVHTWQESGSAFSITTLQLIEDNN